ncbi:MAG: uroporphyrinogen-III C-methyltransferase [Candidatus Omnitrophica bacterium]|nr:uroporphyrinogen-III C-methyltransferase [Candidatus Omnitrophota bacterium]
MGNKIKGKVFLAGVGPGNEALITQAALECIKAADVIIYDHLVSPDLLENAPSGVKIIYAGKSPRRHSLKQEQINRILVNEAGKHRVVVRLKGGDPFLFGRGAEEALALKKAKIAFEIVPGVSSGMAAASYAGIALTQRGISSQVTFVTGHEDPKKKDKDIDWSMLARSKGTLVVFMGMSRLKEITAELINGGMKKDTPVCVSEWGTLPKQRSVTGTIENIAGKIKKNGLTNPAIVIIGKVVNLRKKLNWYETKPLFGKKILITRPEIMAGLFSSNLKQLGAQTCVYPLIEVVREVKINAKRLISGIKQSNWVVFTSKSAVDICFRELENKNLDARLFSGAKVAVLGWETQAELKERGIIADIIPKKFFMESLAAEFKKIDIRKKRIFIPHSRQGRKLLVDELRAQGAIINEMFIYSVCRPREASARKLRKLIKDEQFDFITFTSSSCVHQFMKFFKKEKALVNKQKFACIGPVTEQTLQSYGFKAETTAKVFTIEGLIKAMLIKRKKTDDD